MSTNFGFLESIKEYKLFASACIEAERVLNYSPAMSVAGSRKALELAVKWVYSADNTMKMPYKNNLQSLVHEPTFRFAVNRETWGKFPYIINIGNLAIHTDKTVTRGDAILSLSSLFEFIEWIDYCYGTDYEERKFDEALFSGVSNDSSVNDTTEIEKILEEKDSKISNLLKEVAKISEQLTKNKKQFKEERKFTPEDISEFETRRRYIDVELRLLGWEFKEGFFRDCVEREVPVKGMPKELGSGNGFVDYVLYGKDGTPLAIIEAKRTTKDAKKGKHQAWLYANCIEEMTGNRPIIFNTNGFETYIWDDKFSPQRQVSGVFSKDDLQRLYNRRNTRKDLNKIQIDDKITDRYYQKEAIRAVCNNIDEGHQKSLLVMATGTGKTRTASSLTDVLSRGEYVTNILFLADRKALVRQAKNDFKNYLPHMSLCNLVTNKDDRNARIVFSTYPTMLNSIDTVKNEDGKKLFTPAHFDLIIIDEAHRSIFNKYRAIFEYFDAYIVGLTATPKAEVHSNTYEFFEVAPQVPTYAYDYDTAVKKDKVLVPFHNIEVTTKFLGEGINYDELEANDKDRYEEDFIDEDGEIPDKIPAPEINKFIFNQNTVDMVINDLMTNGIKEASGNRVGKTIIFAQNKKHANYIVERFEKLYPKSPAGFCQRVICNDDYAQDIIDRFKDSSKEPHIAVSVDMLDTGIDVPEIVNLVFFKKVYSKTKFWQMIGRGTRLRPDLFGSGEHKDKFIIFDYLGNFEFFRQNKNGIEASVSQSPVASIFSKKVKLIFNMQDSAFSTEDYQELRTKLIDEVVSQIVSLNIEGEDIRVDVKLKLRYVEKYNKKEAFVCLSDSDRKSLIENISNLVVTDETDDKAINFDNLMYGLMVSQIEGTKVFNRIKKDVIKKATNLLTTRTTIPQVKAKIPLLQRVIDDEFWNGSDILNFEKIRVELRDLMKFVDYGDERKSVYTNLTDFETSRTERKEMEAAYEFEDYKLKVNRYIEENKNNMAIHKLHNNIPLTSTDYKSLENILTGELGTKEDYEKQFGNTPFGLLVRKVAKLDYEAATKAFSKFINEQALNQNQIVFVKSIIDYIAEHGYLENVKALVNAPFDKPDKFVKLFDAEKQKEIAGIVNSVKDNATKIVG
ncbi:DEAD/DEAH box helicase family protein [Clostridium beijerinckii]|uniref:Type-1 restriction enzyme R protein n=1 Tax=Clostridium beijerinckii TaxID=1520 RepID=A0A1S8S3L9_CLOBE|nr:DEAD/DEAH box helicase family protein [Clostridium beijerinckii]NRY60648.1 type I restriction enzyme R subunit [Clostridium beijerinckii]OOM60048.1 type-1 restriction enzyme R protein [Clostridium beijerinckii]